jgi:hypothetical protein
MNTTTSANIRAELARAGITQLGLAQSFNPAYTEAAISRRMSGAVEWRLAEVQHVARFLGVPLSALVTDTDNPGRRVTDLAS